MSALLIVTHYKDWFVKKYVYANLLKSNILEWILNQ